MKILYKIQEIRTAQNITLRELSKKTGISHGYLNEIENNLKQPSFLKMVLIAKALKVQLYDLYEEKRD